MAAAVGGFAAVFLEFGVEGVEDGDEQVAPEFFVGDGAAAGHEVGWKQVVDFGNGLEVGEGNEGFSAGTCEEGEDAVELGIVPVLKGVQHGNGDVDLFGGIFGQVVDDAGVDVLADFFGLEEIPGEGYFAGDVVVAPHGDGLFRGFANGKVVGADEVLKSFLGLLAFRCAAEVLEAGDDAGCGLDVVFVGDNFGEANEEGDGFDFVAHAFIGLAEGFEGEAIIGLGVEDLFEGDDGALDLGVRVGGGIGFAGHGLVLVGRRISVAPTLAEECTKGATNGKCEVARRGIFGKVSCQCDALRV